MIAQCTAADLKLKADRLARTVIKLAVDTFAVAVLTIRLPDNHMTARKGGMRGVKRRNGRLRLVKRNFCVDLVIRAGIRNRRRSWRWNRRDHVHIQDACFDVITVAVTAVGLPGHNNLAVCVQGSINVSLRTGCARMHDKGIPNGTTLSIKPLTVDIHIIADIRCLPEDNESVVRKHNHIARLRHVGTARCPIPCGNLDFSCGRDTIGIKKTHDHAFVINRRAIPCVPDNNETTIAETICGRRRLAVTTGIVQDEGAHRFDAAGIKNAAMDIITATAGGPIRPGHQNPTIRELCKSRQSLACRSIQGLAD